jgi:hypothetical protein
MRVELKKHRSPDYMTLRESIPIRTLWCILFLSMPFAGNCQTPNLPTTVKKGYVNPNGLGSEVREYLRAYGTRLIVPGNETTTLIGTYSDGKTTVPATITFQLPNQTRLDLGGASTKTLILNGSQPSVTAAGADQDLLETLTDDTAESFFFGLTNGLPTQLLGTRYRNDDGKAATYTGPLRDIYRRRAPVAAVAGAPVRDKLFLFDSLTKSFAGCRYTITRNGSPVNVQITHGTWMTVGAGSFPSSITRTENGTQVFSISIVQASTAAKSAGSFFAIP